MTHHARRAAFMLLLFTTVLTAGVAQASSFDSMLAEVDSRIDAWRSRTAEQPRSWDAPTQLAGALYERAKLTGDHGDYDEAVRATRLAFARAPEGAGPFLFRARLRISLHRLTAAEADLAQAERVLLLDDRARARILALRGEIAMQRGQYDTAEALYTQSQLHSPGFGPLAQRAHARWQAGHVEAAEAGYEEAEAALLAPAPDRRAWLELQRGILDLERGELDAAAAHYRAAEEYFPGWPELREHVEALRAKRGDAAVATRARD